MRLLATELTGVPVRRVDALFGDRGVSLGRHSQPSETDESQRRERMRRYLVTLDLDDSADAMKLTSVFRDELHEIVRTGLSGWVSDNSLRDKWVRILTEDGFDSSGAKGKLTIS